MKRLVRRTLCAILVVQLVIAPCARTYAAENTAQSESLENEQTVEKQLIEENSIFADEIENTDDGVITENKTGENASEESINDESVEESDKLTETTEGLLEGTDVEVVQSETSEIMDEELDLNGATQTKYVIDGKAYDVTSSSFNSTSKNGLKYYYNTSADVGIITGTISTTSCDGYGDTYPINTVGTVLCDFSMGSCTSLSHFFSSGSSANTHTKKIYFGEHFDSSKVTDMSYMFRGCETLTDVV